MTAFTIVDFHPCHAPAISLLYHQAIQAIQHPRYNSAKKLAWSRAPRSTKHWQLRYKLNKAWLVQNAQQQIVGFIGIETQFHQRGYIDCLYVDPHFQHQGIASLLIEHLQCWAKSQHYQRLSVDASYLSKPLFERHNFRLIKSNLRVKNNQTLAAFYLEKVL
ncbi:GNAT family N-acetyltransferase [Shewanella holmiensis]|uniref:GNAT family N-acetyltransferase n=1 Tax=Shewanella holmiensis TaxID=2952222 RepID=A0A9X2WPH4_9GAMM|nr:GNAT family N-acetyltransferase [Shewanella holmiensis]MCT7943162.1 GNAT family N-acetyltransferase [Shewanella holmiensis]